MGINLGQEWLYKNDANSCLPHFGGYFDSRYTERFIVIVNPEEYTMQKSFVIEIRITDFIGNMCPGSNNPEYHLDVIDLFEKQLESIIGGMLCIKHFNLPEIQPLKDFGDSWIIQITCCCKDQSCFVEDRIKAILK